MELPRTVQAYAGLLRELRAALDQASTCFPVRCRPAVEGAWMAGCARCVTRKEGCWPTP